MQQIYPSDPKRTHFDQPCVLWLTGYSGAGKTTVARKVKALLHDMGVNAVLLDGDDLRRIFSDKWGYERSDRIELAHAYFRLCNTLAAQGVTVVIAAVAMYDSIYKWVRENIDRSFQIYLRVPETERFVRDRATKNLYGSIGNTSKLYDEPRAPDLVIDNHGATSPDGAALAIIDAFATSRQLASDKGRTAHWNRYYESEDLVLAPSDFAISVATMLGTDRIEILEVGCGSGRDAAYFSRLGNKVTAIDSSVSAIELCKRKHASSQVRFLNATLPDLNVGEMSFDAVYSRFCLHAMTEQEEIDTLKAAYQTLRADGSIFVECRSINDPLSRKGEVISPTERIFGHYRRFIILDELTRRLDDAGFSLVSSEESANLAIFGDENPVVIRIHAKKVGTASNAECL